MKRNCIAILIVWFLMSSLVMASETDGTRPDPGIWESAGKPALQGNFNGLKLQRASALAQWCLVLFNYIEVRAHNLDKKGKNIGISFNDIEIPAKIVDIAIRQCGRVEF